MVGWRQHAGSDRWKHGPMCDMGTDAPQHCVMQSRVRQSYLDSTTATTNCSTLVRGNYMIHARQRAACRRMSPSATPPRGATEPNSRRRASEATGCLSHRYSPATTRVHMTECSRQPTVPYTDAKTAGQRNNTARSVYPRQAPWRRRRQKTTHGAPSLNTQSTSQHRGKDGRRRSAGKRSMQWRTEDEQRHVTVYRWVPRSGSGQRFQPVSSNWTGNGPQAMSHIQLSSAALLPTLQHLNGTEQYGTPTVASGPTQTSISYRQPHRSERQ